MRTEERPQVGGTEIERPMAVEHRGSVEPETTFEFGEFRLVPSELLLLRQDQPIALSHKAFEVLQILIERAGHLVEKTELLSTVWNDCYVGEGSLTVAISAIRKALGDSSEEQQLIQTVFGYGYRFVGKVTRAGQTQAGVSIKGASPRSFFSLSFLLSTGRTSSRLQTGAWALGAFLAVLSIGIALRLNTVVHSATTKTASQVRSLAVLPFRYTVGSSPDDKLSAEMADDLIGLLGEDGDLAVRSTDAVLKYAKLKLDPVAVGKEQKVDAVLSGTIEILDRQVKVLAKLERVSDGALLWQGVFERPASQSLDVEDQVAESVEHLLFPGRQSKLSQAFPDPTAKHLYIEGRYHWNERTEDGIRRSIEYYEGATLKDPKFALPYAGLADSYIALAMHNVRSAQDSYPNAEAAARKALELDSGLAEPHATLGQLALHYEWDWVKAGRELRWAIRLNPNLATTHAWYAADLAAGGQLDDALKEALQAEQLDPMSPAMITEVGRIYYLRRQYDQAVAALQRATELSPKYPIPYKRLGMTYMMQGKYSAALRALHQAQILFPADIESEGLIAYVEAKSGNPAAARRVLADLNRRTANEYISGFTMALVSIALGDRTGAFGWLEKCRQERPASLIFASVDPLFDPLRPDPRFAAFVIKAGLGQDGGQMMASLR